MSQPLFWVFAILAVLVGTAVDPRESTQNKLLYWVLPPVVAFVGYLVFTFNPGGAALCAAAILVVMALGWVRSYRPGPGRLNRRNTLTDNDS